MDGHEPRRLPRQPFSLKNLCAGNFANRCSRIVSSERTSDVVTSSLPCLRCTSYRLSRDHATIASPLALSPITDNSCRGSIQTLAGPMENKLSPEQLDLHNRIDEILWSNWDPMGISKIGGARDEYHDYLPDVFRMTLEDAPPRAIAEYLHTVARDKMSLISSVDDHLLVAQMIHDLTHAN